MYRWINCSGTKEAMTRLMSAFTNADVSWQAAAILTNLYGALPSIN